MDASNGYEAVARDYISGARSGIGAATVREWAQRLPAGARVLDLGCGHGIPITEVLVSAGLDVYGIDASPAMVAAFRARFPQAQVECAAVEESSFFGIAFDGIVAVGLLFLLEPETQRKLLAKAARALAPGGHLLFTAPEALCTWTDVMTGRRSESLGVEVYREILAAVGLRQTDTFTDEGGNFYFAATAPEPAA